MSKEPLDSQIAIRLPKPLHEWLKRFSRDNKVSINKLLRNYVMKLKEESESVKEIEEKLS